MRETDAKFSQITSSFAPFFFFNQSEQSGYSRAQLTRYINKLGGINDKTTVLHDAEITNYCLIIL